MYAAVTENSAERWILFGISSTAEGARSTVPAGWHAQADDQPDRFQVVPCSHSLACTFANYPEADGWSGAPEEELIWCLDGCIATLYPPRHFEDAPDVYQPGFVVANPKV